MVSQQGELMVKTAHSRKFNETGFCKITHDLFRTERELDRAELGSKRDAQPLSVEDLS